jgi:hypothetical protein
MSDDLQVGIRVMIGVYWLKLLLPKIVSVNSF